MLSVAAGGKQYLDGLAKMRNKGMGEHTRRSAALGLLVIPPTILVNGFRTRSLSLRHDARMMGIDEVDKTRRRQKKVARTRRQSAPPLFN